jgi:hypothetical protein
MDMSKAIEYVGRIGVAGLVTAILFLGQAGFWVYGTTYKEALAQRDEWKAIALKALLKAEASSAARPIATPAHAAGDELATAKVRLEAIKSCDCGCGQGQKCVCDKCSVQH